MILLYIPFTKENAGDLGGMVELWQRNHSRHHQELIKIMYHGDALEDSVDNHQIKIYVCFHGGESLAAFNHFNQGQADSIAIDTLCKRFNQDFLGIAPEITEIHLYCCGDYKKNRSFATTFQEQLLRSEHCSISHYSGNLYPPNEKGEQYAAFNQELVPVNKTKRILSPLTPKIPEYSYHLSVKAETALAYIETIEKRKWHAFFNHNREKRAKHYHKCRQERSSCIEHSLNQNN